MSVCPQSTHYLLHNINGGVCSVSVGTELERFLESLFVHFRSVSTVKWRLQSRTILLFSTKHDMYVTNMVAAVIYRRVKCEEDPSPVTLVPMSHKSMGLRSRPKQM